MGRRPIWWTRLGAIARVRLRLARMGISSTRVGAKGCVRLRLATTGVMCRGDDGRVVCRHRAEYERVQVNFFMR
jgi:hypothetical protein